MGKTIKFKNDVCLDSPSVLYGSTRLNDKIYGMDLERSKIGTVITTDLITSNCTRNQNNYINSIVLDAGTWIVWGRWRYEGFEGSSWTNFSGTINDAAVSCYDNEGYVDMCISNLVVCGKDHPVYLNLWPRTKDMTVKSNMWAVRIK